jgi:hypothetical protein
MDASGQSQQFTAIEARRSQAAGLAVSAVNSQLKNSQL